MRIAALIIALALIAVACAQERPPAQIPQEPPVEPADEPMLLLSVTYQGGFVPVDRVRTVFTVLSDGTATLRSHGPDGEITTSDVRQLSAEEMDGLRSALDIVGVEPSYGEEWRGQVADAGEAVVEFWNGEEELRTTIDPNIPEAWDELGGLYAWISAQMEAFGGGPADDPAPVGGADEANETVPERTLCTGTPPENCAQVYEPVCGSDGQTHGNACVACMNGAEWYTDGAC